MDLSGLSLKGTPMRRRDLLASIAMVSFANVLPARAAEIGANTPNTPLTRDRIAALDPTQRQVWMDYLATSEAQKARDMEALRLERVGLSVIPADAKGGNGEASMPLRKPDEWYASSDARRVADNIVSFQTPAGGWGKNQPRNAPVRQKGQAYVEGETPESVVTNGVLPNPHWGYVGTIDNGATTTEIAFLARVYTATRDTRYGDSALRGLNYLLTSQFPNGGWPQVWPLDGAYHDCITLNDNAMISVMQVLHEVATASEPYRFVPADLRQRARVAEERALALLLDLQVERGGVKTLWAQQYDALSLMPASARNYEPPALATGESGGVLIYLIQRRPSSEKIKSAIKQAVHTLEGLKIEGKAFVEAVAGDGKRLVAQPGAPTIWARYYSIETLSPIFGNREKKIFDNIDDIEKERRNGYSWFGTSPQKALNLYYKS